MTQFFPLVSGNRLRTFQKPLLVFSVVFLAAYFGRNASQDLAGTLSLVVGGLIGFVVLMRQPVLGLIALIVVALVFKQEIRTGTNVYLNFSVILPLVLAAVWGIRMLKERNIHLVPSRANFPAIGFVLATTVSLIAGNLDWLFNAPEKATLPAQIGGWLLYVLPIGVFLLVANQVDNLVWLRRLVWLFLVLGGLYMATRVFGLGALRNAIFVPGRSLGSVFWIWLVALAFAQFYMNDTLRPWWRLLLALVVIATFYAALVQSREWFSGWMPPLLAVFIIVWLSSVRMRWIILLAGALVIFMKFGDIQNWLYMNLQEYTVYSRQATYPIMLELIKANPILGLGPSNYRHFTNLYPILGWYVKFNSHNNFVDIIAQTGLIGFGFFSWFAYEIGRLGWNLKNQVQDGFSRAYVYAGIGGLVATLFSGVLGDWFLPFVYNVGMSGFRASVVGWIFLGGLVVIDRVVRGQKAGLIEPAG